MFERLLHSRVDRECQRLTARGWIGKVRVERALHPRHTVAVDVGEADDVRGKRRLRIEPVGLTLNGKARFADRIDGLDQIRRGPAAQVEESLVRLQEGEILLLVIL